MAKLTLTDVTSGYGTATKINANNAAIEAALENTLSRDGTSPNTMSAPLDMNSQRILNLPNAVANQEPITLSQAASIAGVTNPLTQEIIGSYLYPRTAAETSAGVTPTNREYPPGDARRYGISAGSSDQTTAIQAALDCGEPVVDFFGMAVKCDEVEVPAGVWAKNVNITKYTNSAGNVVLLNTGSKLTGKVAGTGLTSAIQRCVYVAAQGVTDVELDVEVSAATYGVHAQPTSGTSVADRPKRWKGKVYAHDIVGTSGSSEGYGLLLSPAEHCELVLHAKSIARHALYLSAGSRYNKVVAFVDDCDNYAAQLYSTSGQDATEQNDITIFAQNLDESVSGQGGAIALVQKVHRNTVRVFHDGDGTTTYSVLVEGQSGGPYPLGNKIIDGSITGEFIGNDVIRLLNADSTIVSGNYLGCFSASRVIGLLRSGTNGTSHGGYIENNVIDAQGENCKGIYNEVNAQPSYIGPNEIRNTGTSVRVDDQSGGYREGYSREVRFSGTTASITNASVGDTSAALTREVDTTRRSVHIRFTDSSVSLSNRSVVSRIGTPADASHVDFRIYNDAGSSQTFDYEGVVRGD